MKTLLVIDTETGGLDAETHSILTLAAVIWMDGEIKETLALTIAEPEIVADPRALAVNGLDVDTIRREGLTPEQAVDRLESLVLRNAGTLRVEIVAHNREFDMAFLKRLYRLAHRKMAYAFQGLCTVQIARFLMLAGVLPVANAKADSLFSYFGIDANRSGGTHNALDDAVGCAQLLTKFLEFAHAENKGAETCGHDQCANPVGRERVDADCASTGCVGDAGVHQVTEGPQSPDVHLDR